MVGGTSAFKLDCGVRRARGVLSTREFLCALPVSDKFVPPTHFQDDMVRAQREVMALIKNLKARQSEAESDAKARRELDQAMLSVGARERRAGTRDIESLRRACVCACVRECTA